MSTEMHIGANFGSSYADCKLTNKIFLEVIERADELSNATKDLHSESSISDLGSWGQSYILALCSELIIDLARIMESIADRLPSSKLFVDDDKFDSVADASNPIVLQAANLLAYYREHCSDEGDTFYHANLVVEASNMVRQVCMIAAKLGESDLAPYIEERLGMLNVKHSW